MTDLILLALAVAICTNLALFYFYRKKGERVIFIDSKTGKKRIIDFDKKCCPNTTCSDYEKIGQGNIEFCKTYGKDSRALLVCKTCKKTFSETKNTAYFNVKKPLVIFFSVLAHLNYNDGIRDVGRKVGVHRDTVMAYVRRASKQCEKLDRLLVNLKCIEIQLDELWGFILKKKKNVRDIREYLARFGDCWTWIALDPRTKFVIAHVNGKRLRADCLTFLKLVKARTADGKKLFTSDELKTYAQCISEVFGNSENILYALLHKTRKNGTVLSIEERIVYGEKNQIEKILRESPVSSSINTAFVERKNLDVRQKNRRMTRKTQSFSKSPEMHDCQMNLTIAFGNFCHWHSSIKKSPAMAIGLTDHVWTIDELMAFQ